MGRQVVVPRFGGARTEDDGALGADSKKTGEYWSDQLVVPSRRRQVCRFWLEKAIVLVDDAQIFALMWQLSQPWPWPARWLVATRWVNFFNLDAFSFRSTGAAMGATSQSFSLWGEMPRYWVFALSCALVPWGGVLALHLCKRSWNRQGRSDFLLQTAKWENVLLQALQLVYLPVGLAVLRLVNCNADGAVSVDPMSMGACWSAGHLLAVLSVTFGVGGSFLLGFPWVLHKSIQRYLTQSSAEKHEHFLQGKELEFMLGTSEAYLELYMPQYASYRRHSVGFPVQMCLLKLSLLLVFSILRSPAPATTNQGLQGNLFFFLVTVLSLRRQWRYPYRCISTSRLALLVDGMLVANGIFGKGNPSLLCIQAAGGRIISLTSCLLPVLLCSNGVRSALTVSTSVTSSLSFLNLGFLSVIVVYALRNVILRNPKLRATSVDIPVWPTNERMHAIVGFGAKLTDWVEVIQGAQRMILKSLLVTPSMRSCEDLKTVLDDLEGCCQEAIESDHLLSDQLSELAFYVHELYVEAMASNPFHRTAFPEKELADLSGVLQLRNDRQLLLPPRNKRVLMKLDIARSWSRPRHKVRGNAGLLEERGVMSIEAFLADQYDRYKAAAVVATDWKPVNSLFRVTRDSQDAESSKDPEVLMIEITAWSQTQQLVKCLTVGGPPVTEGALLSLADARQFGMRVELLSSGEPEASSAMLQAL